MRILIIDDDIEVHETLTAFFNSLDYECILTSNAAEGIHKFATIDPDVVFLDVRLPDRCGIDVLQELKKLNVRIPVFMMTAYKDAEKVIEAFRYGAKDCLLKPFNFDYVKNALASLK